MSKNIFSSTDTQTVFAHPGWRFAYNFTTIAVLGITLSAGNSLFAGFMLFGWSVLFDYFKFKPTTNFRKKSRTIGCFWFAALAIISFISLTSMTIEKIGNGLYIKIISFPFFSGSYFSANWTWAIIGLVSLIITCVDWIAEIREVERLIIENNPNEMLDETASTTAMRVTPSQVGQEG